MRVVLLCAGYATRMKEILKGKPKPLIEIDGSRTVLDYIVQNIRVTSNIKNISLVTNSPHYAYFVEWAKKGSHSDIAIVDDGTSSNEDRLGAVGDMALMIADKSDDVMFIATDNLFLTDFGDIEKEFHRNPRNLIKVKEFSREEPTLKNYGTVTLNRNMRVTHMEEKALVPRSNMVAWGVYVIKKEDLHLLDDYLLNGGNPDNSGNIIPYLIEHSDVYAVEVAPEIIDVGTPILYEQALEMVNKYPFWK